MTALAPWLWMALGAVLTLLWLLGWETWVQWRASRRWPPGAAMGRHRLETTASRGDALRKLCEELAEAREETP